MRSKSKLIQRQVLANQLADARPTIDAVHDAVVQAGYHGLTYAPIAGALHSTETRVQRWAVGADIPTSAVERRAILSTISRLLHEMNGLNPVEQQRLADEARWRATESKIRFSASQLRSQRAEAKIQASGDVLCMQCMRRRQTGDEVCGRRVCRLQRQGLPRTAEVKA